ncbi:diguanylate cyclase domain-containing protein [Pseudoteredinibacter isoporae]|uniref:diguanylate cyclase n=1 Tax=Pseudoteredinibacter isoporae TaxID=570281 RepID=A0A7X0MU12_9GAMM|nr:diguanylate cyclase [Pseudoteredinibacter isoporae]MBB6520141.1 diguanylate cyclase (GGDEF)-like protein [Pseudoteredinibacter isoporae]NHO85713.1 diguanylate cyclase [Pseudoteredinibacter isoporae]NIB25835.1 diguanylate cyclase [Pseudoteredinibacter isoporae]
MFQQLKNHGRKLALIFVLLNVQILSTLALGDSKSWQEIDWLDIAGEGGAVWLCLVWLIVLLATRPDGPVTRLLFWGFACFLIASGQDLLDEVVRLPEATVWNHAVESIPMPIGMLLMSIGLLYWYHEQQALNEQLRKRERRLRDHRRLDKVTGLADAQYLSQQLETELTVARAEGLPTSVLMLDIDKFREINRNLGMGEGDRLLRELTELLLLNIRRRDLLCRYAGDRFAIVLPATCQTMAELMARQLEDVCRHFAFRARNSDLAQFHTVSTGVATDGLDVQLDEKDPVEQLLSRANYRLAKAKEARVLKVA